MGNELSSIALSEDGYNPIPPWLDAETHALVRDLVETLRNNYPDLLAVVLYGSVARHDERPLDDAHPSDVDLLTIFDTDDEQITVHRGLTLSQMLGPAYIRHLDAPREVQVMLASRNLREWDPTFVAGVARDGIALYERGWQR
jgi:predicted nucleotidyltransferase